MAEFNSAVMTPKLAGLMLMLDYEHAPIVGTRCSIDLGLTEFRVIAAVEGGGMALLVRGTDERGDWRRNLLAVPWAWKAGASGRLYPAGFLKGAQEIWRWLERRQWLDQIKVVIGHSKGAAEGAIIAASLGVPGVFFASPRSRVAGSKRMPHENRIINIVRRDDLVAWSPPWPLFQHIGGVHYIDASQSWLTPLSNHRLDRHIPYLGAVEHLRMMRCAQ